MKAVKLLFVIMFSLMQASLGYLSLVNYIKYGFIDALPYAFVAVFCMVIAGTINENMRKD